MITSKTSLRNLLIVTNSSFTAVFKLYEIISGKPFTTKAKDMPYFTPNTSNQSNENDDKLVVFTDGSCLGSGTKNARAGYGVFYGNNSERNASVRIRRHQCSRYAELRAVNHALSHAWKHLSRDNQKVTHLEIHTDSKEAIASLEKQPKGRYSAIIRDNQVKLKSLQKKIKVSVLFVKGHSGITGNEEAHRLAQAGAKKKKNEKHKARRKKDCEKDCDKENYPLEELKESIE